MVSDRHCTTKGLAKCLPPTSGPLCWTGCTGEGSFHIMNHFCMISDENFIRIHWSVWRASIPFVRVGGVRTPSCRDSQSHWSRCTQPSMSLSECLPENSSCSWWRHWRNPGNPQLVPSQPSQRGEETSVREPDFLENPAFFPDLGEETNKLSENSRSQGIDCETGGQAKRAIGLTKFKLPVDILPACSLICPH